eukprot:scaffold2224_cov261-Pinguiococcus_pyrenoidosus.AAC.9
MAPKADFVQSSNARKVGLPHGKVSQSATPPYSYCEQHVKRCLLIDPLFLRSACHAPTGGERRSTEQPA